jgi:glycosyltransferase involved in cell wall biosynthesis
MDVLLLNNHYGPGGGAETVAVRTQRLLESAGHRVLPFAVTADGTRPPTGRPRLVPARSDGRARGPLAGVYSVPARRELERLLRNRRFDVAHAHNVYEFMTLSVVGALVRRRLPVVLTLHDYRAICPNGVLHTHDGVCRRCPDSGRFGHAVTHRCVRGSAWKSAVAAVEARTNSWRRAYDRADVLVAPSRLLRRTMASAGLSADAFRVVPNPVPAAPLRDRVAEPPTFVFAGRLVEAKGVDVLLEAARRLTAGERIVILGGGRLESPLRRRAAAERLPVEVRGFEPPAAVAHELRRATALVFPSRWVENCPMAILEAASVGVPTIASDLGAMRDLVDDGRDGVLVPEGDDAALAAAMATLARNQARARNLGRRARTRVRRDHSEDGYLESILDCYRLAAERSAQRRAVRAAAAATNAP